MESAPLTPQAAAAALERLPLPLLLLDRHERLLAANAAARAAFGARAEGTPLTEIAPQLASEPLADDDGALRVACLLTRDAATVAGLAAASADAGSLAHEIKNVRSAVNLALRAVARALGEDEQEVLTDLAQRLAGLEARIRTALSAPQA